MQVKFPLQQDSPPAGNRKSRTARAITCPRITYQGGGGYPMLSWPGYILPLNWCIPQKGPRTSYCGIPPRKDMGPVEVLWDGDRVPPPPWGWTDKQIENITFPILRMRAIINKAIIKNVHVGTQTEYAYDEFRIQFTLLKIWRITPSIVWINVTLNC